MEATSRWGSTKAKTASRWSTRKLHMALLREIECGGSDGWYQVYLPNVQGDMPAAEFAARLGALRDMGLYKPMDGHDFGYVRREP